MAAQDAEAAPATTGAAPVPTTTRRQRRSCVRLEAFLQKKDRQAALVRLQQLVSAARLQLLARRWLAERRSAAAAVLTTAAEPERTVPKRKSDFAADAPQPRHARAAMRAMRARATKRPADEAVERRAASKLQRPTAPATPATLTSLATPATSPTLAEYGWCVIRFCNYRCVITL